MKKIFYIISDIDKSLAFEWIAKSLQKKNQEIHYILLNPSNSALESYLRQENLLVTRITVNGKKSWSIAWLKLRRILKQSQPKAIHCHLLQANILGLTAAWSLRIPKRIFTRHHATLHYQYHKKGIFWDKLCNWLATDIIAISNNVKNILIQMDKTDARKVHLVPHGFDWHVFREYADSQVELLKHKYNLYNKAPIVGCISRFIELKGIQYLIPAFQRFQQQYPDAILVLANAQGDYAAHLHKQLDTLPPHSYRLISFEPDLGSLYQCFDLFVHVPIDSEAEAFGQTYVEALAAEIPSIFTLSGIATDFVKHEHNALVVPFCDSDAIYEALDRLWNDADLRKKLTHNGWLSVKEEFSLEKMINRLEAIYAE